MCNTIVSPNGTYRTIAEMRSAGFVIPDWIIERPLEAWNESEFAMSRSQFEQSCFCISGEAVEPILIHNNWAWKIDRDFGDYLITKINPIPGGVFSARVDPDAIEVDDYDPTEE